MVPTFFGKTIPGILDGGPIGIGQTSFSNERRVAGCVVAALVERFAGLHRWTELYTKRSIFPTPGCSPVLR
jgi:hypothetical protein